MKDTQIKIHITGKDDTSKLQLIAETVADQITTIAGNAGMTTAYSLAVGKPRGLLGYTIDTFYDSDLIGDYIVQAISQALADHHNHAGISAEKIKI